ncbi:hypothetical protein AJ80_09147 [Polytolypa hystricis UAMH7299]|uniref:F-box domain-containing protein n=1 Tax=Polytolypa hystricis (strain UAMH7299) TaxID=1447883 RepID=A0A2B7WV28_POLH7|nr:hypothetical protein AJ80_09147 [Polytolypa hystricis UAMH7299]
MAAAALDSLPTELIYCIASSLDRRDLNSLIRSSRRYAELLTRELYGGILLESTAIFEEFGPRWESKLILQYFESLSAPVINRTSSYGLILLHNVAASGNVALLKILLANGAELETRDSTGWSAVFHAAERGHEAAVRFLLDSGADVSSRGLGDGCNVLILAVAKGSTTLIQLLIDTMQRQGLDIHKGSKGHFTPLHAAAASGNSAAIQTLLDAGADPFSAGDDGDFPLPLFYAIEYDRAEACKLLITVMNTVRENCLRRHGVIGLEYALRSNRNEAAEVLIDAGVPVDIELDPGLSSLKIALRKGNPLVFSHMLATYPRLSASKHLQIGLYAACESGNYKFIELLVDLFLTGETWIDLSAAGGPYQDWTPLHYAVRGMKENPSPELNRAISRLVRAGANVLKGGHLDESPAYIAARDGCLDAVNVFISTTPEAAWSVDGHGRTLLHIAACNYRPRGVEAVRLLIDAGADVNAYAPKDRTTTSCTLEDCCAEMQGWTPLHFAARMHANPDMISLLIKSGADTSAKSEKGEIPAHVAASAGFSIADWAAFGDGVDLHKGCEVCDAAAN